MSTSFAAVVLCVLLATSAAVSLQRGDAESCVIEEGPRAGSKMLQTQKDKVGDNGEDSRHSHHHGHRHGHAHADDSHAHGRAKLRTAPLKVKVTTLETDMAGLKTDIATLETMVGLEVEAAGEPAAGAAAEAVAPAAEAVAPAALLKAPEAALLAADFVEAADGTLKQRITTLESFFSDARSRVMSLNNEVLGAAGFVTLLATGTAKAADNGAFSKTSTTNCLRERVDSMEDWADHLKIQVTTLQREVMGTTAAATPAATAAA